MRKIEYSHLADILKREITVCRDSEQSADNRASEDCWRIARLSLESVAHSCSRSLSVDRVAFLKACGIT